MEEKKGVKKDELYVTYCNEGVEFLVNVGGVWYRFFWNNGLGVNVYSRDGDEIDYFSFMGKPNEDEVIEGIEEYIVENIKY